MGKQAANLGGNVEGSSPFFAYYVGWEYNDHSFIVQTFSCLKSLMVFLKMIL